MRTLPKGPKRLCDEIGMLALWIPNFWKILKTRRTKLNKYGSVVEIGPYPRKWAENWWRRNKI